MHIVSGAVPGLCRTLLRTPLPPCTSPVRWTSFIAYLILFYTRAVILYLRRTLPSSLPLLPHLPGQVDFLQCSILQFCDRPGKPIFCVEQLIEGDYIKYNSNSGEHQGRGRGTGWGGAGEKRRGRAWESPRFPSAVVSEPLTGHPNPGHQHSPPSCLTPGFVKGDDDVLRHTPQAFSHYTFELTHGHKMCVDIQVCGHPGVGTHPGWTTTPPDHPCVPCLLLTLTAAPSSVPCLLI